MRPLLPFLLALFVGVGATARVAGQTPSVQLDVRQLMTAKDFAATGLAKLSGDEVRQLNQWLTTLALRILQTSQGGPGGCGDVIESQIEGTFNGWTGETVFKLTNGQIWQQASYAYTYHYRRPPRLSSTRL